mgnify:FL=1
MKKRATFKNGKDHRKSVKPATRGICADCQYKIYEASVDKVKVKEKDVFDKPNQSRSQNQTQTRTRKKKSRTQKSRTPST